MQTIINTLGILRRLGTKEALYVLLMLLPGGSLVALVLFLHHNGKLNGTVCGVRLSSLGNLRHLGKRVDAVRFNPAPSSGKTWADRS